MRTVLTIFLLSMNFMASAAFAGDRVVARVGNEAITHRELTAAIEQNPNLPREKILDLLIERQLVLIWAAGKNISVSTEELDQTETSIREKNKIAPDQFEKALASTGDTLESFRENLRVQITINKAMGLALSSQIQASDSELQELYLKTYPRKTTSTVSHILLAVDEGAPVEKDEAVERSAEQILARIANGASFNSMVSEYSQDSSSADKGGRLGTFNEGELLPELENLAATLEPGEVGGPVRTSAGYHILRLESRGTVEPPPFTEVRNTLERSLMADREESVRTRWLNELKKTTYIEVFPDDG
ncbi:MAG: peptidylprolyl isomerase [bacterium]|nr:peptidylprolyl isomerase [bacterium]MDT8365791.1 peptidylprolyl isomerase [bacterium]